MMKRLLLCYLFLAQCSALSMNDLQDTLRLICGLGDRSEDQTELYFYCKLTDDMDEDSVQELLDTHAYVQMKDHLFDRMFSPTGIIEMRHSFKVPTSTITLENSYLSFVVAREGFPEIKPPPIPT